MNKAPETAVILSSGAATLNGHQVAAYPKLLLPIANRPLVEYLASVLEAAGVKRLLILAFAESQENEIKEGLRRLPQKVEVVFQERPRGTGGSLKLAGDRLQGEPFWVVHGGLLLQTDLQEMLDQHRQSGTAATVGAVRLAEEAWHMERVQSDAEGRIDAIHRIHPCQERRSMLWPVGLYLFEPSVLDLIPAGKYFDLKEQLPAQLQENGKPARVWEINGYCRLLNGINDFVRANEDVLLGRVHFLVGSPPAAGESRGATGYISPGAVIKEPVAVGASARLEAGSMVIGPSAVGEDCHIGAQAVVSESIIFPGARIGQAAYLSHCIIGEGVEIGNSVCLHETMVLSDPSGGEKEIRTDSGMEHSGGQERIKTIRMPQIGAHRFYRLVKRVMDIFAAALGLLIFSPLLAIIAVAIKIDSPGPVVFSQRRCGIWGKEFNMYKFRSMVVNAEELKTELMKINETDGPMFKIISDPRVTRVGRFLRATNLDELPQFWNVLWGDLSLVGPRPLAMEEMRLNPQWRDIRLSVPPGVTGYWQITAHDKVHFAEWIRCDIDYVRNFSFWTDMKVLFRTAIKFLPGLFSFGKKTTGEGCA